MVTETNPDCLANSHCPGAKEEAKGVDRSTLSSVALITQHLLSSLTVHVRHTNHLSLFVDPDTQQKRSAAQALESPGVTSTISNRSCPFEWILKGFLTPLPVSFCFFFFFPPITGKLWLSDLRTQPEKTACSWFRIEISDFFFFFKGPGKKYFWP